MILYVDSDTAYLVKHSAKGRADGYFYCSDHISSKLNGPIYCLSTPIKVVISSIGEAELGGLFLNVTNVVFIHNVLYDIIIHNYPHQSKRIIPLL